MKMKTSLLIVLSIIILVITSCDRPKCENKNPIFDEFNIDSEKYKLELLNQINKYGKENLTYWLDSYLEDNGKEYIIVNIQNNYLCAKGMIRVKDWSKLKGIKRTKGIGYIGAKLKGLSFIIDKDSLKTEFIYKDITRIVD